MKIAITGAHSTGKSRFIANLKEHLLNLCVPCLDLHHNPEGCPYPIEMSQSFEATAWIVFKAMMKEIEALRSSPLLLLDRTVVDAWAYCQYWKSTKTSNSNELLETALYQTIKAWLPTYDIIVKTRIEDNLEPKLKDIPHDNRSYRLGVQNSIDEFLRENLPSKVIVLRYGCDEKVISEILSLLKNKNISFVQESDAGTSSRYNSIIN